MHGRDGVIVVRKKENYFKHVNVILIPFQQLTSSAGWASKREKRVGIKKTSNRKGLSFGRAFTLFFYFILALMECSA